MATTNIKRLIESTFGSVDIAYASLTLTAADATANTVAVDFNNFLDIVDVAIVQTRDANNNLSNERFDITWSGTIVTVADGSTDTLASDDQLVVIAFGKAR